LVRAIFANENPLGQRLQFAPGSSQEPYEIVGVVGDIRHNALEFDPAATMYLPTYETGQANWVLRTAADPMSFLPAVRKEVMAMDPDQPIARIRLMEQLIYESVGQPRFRTLLIGLFAALALGLAAVGLYGVMSYTVQQRAREIGIRVAIGAQKRDVLRLVVGHGLGLVLTGMLLGSAGAVGLTRLINTMLYQVKPTDPTTFASVCGLLAMVAFCACWLPARRASRVDPMEALRCE